MNNAEKTKKFEHFSDLEKLPTYIPKVTKNTRKYMNDFRVNLDP